MTSYTKGFIISLLLDAEIFMLKLSYRMMIIQVMGGSYVGGIPRRNFVHTSEILPYQRRELGQEGYGVIVFQSLGIGCL
jgi:hypothetical protein